MAGLSVPQVGHSRVGQAIPHLLGHAEVVVGGGGHQGLVGHAEHLALGRQLLKQFGHGAADAAAHTGIDLIKQQRHVLIGRRQAGFQRQQEARHLTAGGHLRQGSQRLARVGGKQKLHRVSPLLRGGGGLDRHGKAHVGEAHGPQPGQQLLLQLGGRRLPGGGEGAMGPVTVGSVGLLRQLKGLQAGVCPTGGQLLPQNVPAVDQLLKREAMAALQRLELGDALLQVPQAVGIAVEGGAVAVELAGQVLELGEPIAAAGAELRHGGIQLLHGGQFALAGRQMIEHRGRFIGPLHQPTDQRHHPLLQAHPMGQAVFLGLQQLPLGGILQLGRLQIRQQLLLPLPLLLQLLPVGLGLLEGLGGAPPAAVGLRRRSQQGLQRFAREAVQPAPLLTGPRQLLGLPLNGEIQQQRAQLLDLGPVDRHPIEPVAAAEPLLAEAPLPAQQQFTVVGLQLLLLEPLQQGWGEAETGLDHATLRPLAQQAGAGSPQQRIERVQQDRLAGAGFTSEHRESAAELQLQPLNQSDVLEAQAGEHRQAGVGPDRSGRSFRLEGGQRACGPRHREAPSPPHRSGGGRSRHAGGCVWPCAGVSQG